MRDGKTEINRGKYTHRHIQKERGMKTDRKEEKLKAGKPYRRGRLSSVDLLVLTSLDQLLFVL